MPNHVQPETGFTSWRLRFCVANSSSAVSHSIQVVIALCIPASLFALLLVGLTPTI